MSDAPTARDGIDQAIIEHHVTVLERFVGYLADKGIQVQMVEAIAKAIPGHGDDTPQVMIQAAFGDVVDTGIWGEYNGFDLQRVIDGAASLEFLVRYARQINSSVFPPDAIPSDEAVQAALTLFHESRAQVAITEHAE